MAGKENVSAFRFAYRHLRSIAFLCIFLLASFVRLYQFLPHIEFLDDQGRDVYIIKNIFINHDVTLLGPRTSVGNMFLGPLYYYAMIPALALTYPNPSGPAYAIAGMGILTTALMYILGRRMVGDRASLISMLLYATAPVVVKLSRFSWQPNPAPLFGLLLVYALFRASKTGRLRYWIASFLCGAVLTQFHYVALLAGAPLMIVWIYQMIYKKTARKNLILSLGVGVIFLLALISPLIFFDYRHEGIIRKGFVEFSESMKNGAPSMQNRVRLFTQDIHGVSMRVLVEILGVSNQQRLFNTYLVIAYAVYGSVLVFKKRSHALNILFLFLSTGIVGLTLYRNTMFEHYFAYLFPAVFLSTGVLLASLSRVHKIIAGIISLFVIVFAFMNVRSLSIWNSASPGIPTIETISNEVLPSIPEGAVYNIALLNDNREYMAMKYRYFFDIDAKKAPQSQYDYTNLEYLVVIVENGEQVETAPIHEIRQFFLESKNVQLIHQQAHQWGIRSYIYAK
ncbi:MAG TPA: hypothetical protein DCW55_03465 [Candidatus Pacebacteria bacterium]|nr:MAG: Glycosyl transferase family 39 [Microgenomates group bacterium GW2011_GWF1_44_10]OGJ41240.1 MAG: hypothetical protein A2378_01590 [Candidatus Pacebacteria bacterium RIFOXYB1_FULL_44_10]HAU99265.1 hypothetical protein [Candidatus Paceibacterota bacterium]HAX01796.1 hypothetical protein [Candidatus Paceibacterota bacterium]